MCIDEKTFLKWSHFFLPSMLRCAPSQMTISFRCLVKHFNLFCHCWCSRCHNCFFANSSNSLHSIVLVDTEDGSYEDPSLIGLFYRLSEARVYFDLFVFESSNNDDDDDKTQSEKFFKWERRSFPSLQPPPNRNGFYIAVTTARPRWLLATALATVKGIAMNGGGFDCIELLYIGPAARV